MKILYLRTNVVSDEDVVQILGRMKCSLTLMRAPQHGDGAEEYAEKLLKSIEEQGTELVLSLKYFSVVSLVCNAVLVKYAAWIVTAYDSGMYSCTLLNSCNFVFVADYGVYEEFKNEDFPHLYYLPLGACMECVDRVNSKMAEGHADNMTSRTAESSKDDSERKYLADLLLPCVIQSRERLGLHPLSPDSPLRDATKGYLEGALPVSTRCRGSLLWQDIFRPMCGRI